MATGLLVTLVSCSCWADALCFKRSTWRLTTHLEVMNTDAHSKAASLASPVHIPRHQFEILREMPSRGGHWCPKPGGGNLPRNRDPKGRRLQKTFTEHPGPKPEASTPQKLSCDRHQVCSEEACFTLFDVKWGLCLEMG